MSTKGRLDRQAKRYIARELEERGFTRARLEAHLRRFVRPRPRWIPKDLWAVLVRITVRELPPMAKVELENAERQLVDAILDHPREHEEILSTLRPLVRRIRDLRARLAPHPARD